MRATVEMTLPSYWASYLINADSSALSENEVTVIEMFREDQELGWCLGVSEDSWFSYGNDFDRMGGEVSSFTFEIRE
jgi:hypothetical protein